MSKERPRCRQEILKIVGSDIPLPLLLCNGLIHLTPGMRAQVRKMIREQQMGMDYTKSPKERLAESKKENCPEKR